MHLKRILIYVQASILLCFGMSIQVEAKVSNTEEYERLVSRVNHSLEAAGIVTPTEVGGIYLADKEGNKIFGYYYDNAGEIYYTEEEEIGPGMNMGSYYRNKHDKFGTWFDANGNAANLSSADPEIYDAKCKEFEEKGKQPVESDSDTFFGYYICQYSLGDIQNLTCEHNGYNWIYPVTAKYDRNKVIDKIGATLGATSVSGDNTTEKVYNAVELVKNNFYYDVASMNFTISECLDTRTGVCAHFAALTAFLLRNSGVKAEICQGFMGTDVSRADIDLHAWIRVWDNDHWIYSDPSACVCLKNMDSCFIPMETYITNYHYKKLYYVYFD